MLSPKSKPGNNSCEDVEVYSFYVVKLIVSEKSECGSMTFQLGFVVL